MTLDIYDSENLVVRHDNGQYITMLNGSLVRKQNLSAEIIELLKYSHVTGALIFDTMRRTDNGVELKNLARMFENLEYMQQELWGFAKDKNYHCWYNVPKCSCPKMDNRNTMGTDVRFFNLSCKIHGEEK